MTRTDAHSPANLNPEDYEYVGTLDVQRNPRYHSPAANREAKRLFDLLESEGFDGNFRNKGTCDHCGVSFRYGVVVRYTITGDVLIVGHQCGSERFALGSQVEYDRKRAESQAKAQATRERNTEFEADFRESHPDLAEAMYTEPQPNVRHPLADNDILLDMSHRLRQYGTLSEKQVRFASDLFAEMNGEVRPRPNEAPATEAQIRFATTLCEERGLDPKTELEGLGKQSISAKIDALKKTPKAGQSKAEYDVTVDVPEVPEGYYAIDRNGIEFYKVDAPTEGKWAGYVFVTRLHGAPGDWNREPVKDRTARAKVLRAIGSDVEAATVLFGRESAYCGICGSPLSDETSRYAGIGPVCAKNNGIDQAALAAEGREARKQRVLATERRDADGDLIPF